MLQRREPQRRDGCVAVDPCRTVTVPRGHPLAMRAIRVVVVLGVATSLAACAATRQRVGGWFGIATPTPTPSATPIAKAASQVYYAGAAGLQVYSKPSVSSKVVGKLALHEKVRRYKLERGYAYVESDKSGVKGWVSNEQLIRRLPGTPTTAAPAPAVSEPDEAVVPAAPSPEEPVAPAAEEPQAPIAAEATETPELPSPTPTSTPVPAGAKPTPRGVAPSIFDPY